ncbi:hypothetical protein CEXT_213401 [Caerostris extrusa]|uniref:Uncharacterized protein n=1 Tax=Caerostris extrusa TaxID=172846 RepID=A0AAV4P4Q9_CAEEX|nr:hypothetical protein CEXT_213401 [Caerostris extrusa]
MNNVERSSKEQYSKYPIRKNQKLYNKRERHDLIYHISNPTDMARHDPNYNVNNSTDITRHDPTHHLKDLVTIQCNQFDTGMKLRPKIFRTI